MNETNIDWTSFDKRIVINKPMQEVYTAWATQSKMETWFLEKAQYFDKNLHKRKANEPTETGDSFVWKWNNWDFEEKGQIFKANGKDFISFSFGSAGIVEVKLNAENENTEVWLTQKNIPSDEKSKMELYVGCSTGWTFWLANLKAWMEHGIVLHAKGLKQSETKDLVNS